MGCCWDSRSKDELFSLWWQDLRGYLLWMPENTNTQIWWICSKLIFIHFFILLSTLLSILSIFGSMLILSELFIIYLRFRQPVVEIIIPKGEMVSGQLTSLLYIKTFSEWAAKRYAFLTEPLVFIVEILTIFDVDLVIDLLYLKVIR